jgi:thiamine-monophosphate kinase
VSALVRYDDIPRIDAFAALKNPELEKDCVLSGGDDYELLFTAARERRSEVQALSRELGVPLTRIGAVLSGQPRLVVVDGAGRPIGYKRAFDHFAGR